MQVKDICLNPFGVVGLPASCVILDLCVVCWCGLFSALLRIH